jgi:hypothetical protein
MRAEEGIAMVVRATMGDGVTHPLDQRAVKGRSIEAENSGYSTHISRKVSGFGWVWQLRPHRARWHNV